MTNTSRNASIASWAASVVLGTYLGAFGFATLVALSRGSVVRWLVLLAVCSVLAALQVVVIGAVDVVLLWLRVRMLPSGRIAWLSSIGASMLVWSVGLLWPFARWTSPVTFGLSILVPMVLVSLAVRLLFGERCSAR